MDGSCGGQPTPLSRTRQPCDPGLQWVGIGPWRACIRQSRSVADLLSGRRVCTRARGPVPYSIGARVASGALLQKCVRCVLVRRRKAALRAGLWWALYEGLWRLRVLEGVFGALGALRAAEGRCGDFVGVLSGSGALGSAQ